jgi:hypothetical protein
VRVELLGAFELLQKGVSNGSIIYQKKVRLRRNQLRCFVGKPITSSFMVGNHGR